MRLISSGSPGSNALRLIRQRPGQIKPRAVEEFYRRIQDKSHASMVWGS